jgi:hypothetical protein
MADSELLAYLALLNSRFMTWYFRTVQPRTGRLFAELKIQHLVDFPRPAAAAWARALPELARLAAEAERLAAGEEETAGVDAAIDAAVAAAFGLAPPESGSPAPEPPGASPLPARSAPRTAVQPAVPVVPRC